MSAKLRIKSSKRSGRIALAVLALNFALLTFDSTAASVTNSTPLPPERAPETPRDFYNAGTRKLQEKKLREAEAYLETSLARQDEAVQPAALFNLGHVRFAQGAELLEKAPQSSRVTAGAQSAVSGGAAALQEIETAQRSRQLDSMVRAYLHGRGARKELNSAMKAIRKALETYGEVLGKWNRSLGDFQSAAELKPADHKAKENADIVSQHIARLIDQIRLLQQAMMAAAQMQQELGEKLQQLRGQIPDDAMPPGAPGEGEEEDEMPNGLQPGMQEGPSRQGEEQSISPEEAGQILNGFRLDGDRRLPMGGDQPGKPNDPNRKTW
jgi:tetratricopeptide (TPR) repeat protein